MSLINDALKRAKQAQQENPPATPPLEFRPVEPGQKEARDTTLLRIGLSVVIVMILGLAGTLVWFVAQSDQGPLPVVARAADAPAIAEPESAPVEPTPVAQPEPAAPVASDAPSPVVENPEEPKTNSVPVSAPEVMVVKPPPLKLQGIFFNPSNPSAVVNGRTLYLGERVSGFRLLAISPVAVTLASATETNVLSLSE